MKRLMTATAALLFACALPGTYAADVPGGDEVKKVLDYYYYSASGTPVLVEFKLCQGVYQDGVDKHNCRDELAADELETGATAYAWMNLLVPRDERGEVLLQLRHHGVVRDTRSTRVYGAVRYRTWRKIRLDRAGEWQIPILYDNRTAVHEIDTVTLNVREPMITQLGTGTDPASLE